MSIADPNDPAWTGGKSTSGERSAIVERLLLQYVDRINAGERPDREEILAAHPDEAPELLRQLALFMDLDGEGCSGAALRRIGEFQLVKQIGRGGMGVVYEARQESMERRVALKILPAGVAADARTLTRFLREAKVAGKLQHPNIVSVHGMGVEAGTPYYSMELVEGETLSEVITRARGEEKPKGSTKANPNAEAKRGPLDAAEVDIVFCGRVAEAFAGVAEGLYHAHTKGVIHRDLKPSNLILDRASADGAARLRILDFGLARQEGEASLTQTGDFMGTPLYMSPEQAMARRIPIDHRTDIYSLGATMYELLARRPPFQGKSTQETLSQIIFRDPPPLRAVEPRVPRDLETIILKCLTKDPRDRYGTAEALAQDLRRFVRNEPIEARAESALGKFARKLHCQRRRLAVAGLILAALAFLFAFLHERGLETRRRYEQEVQGHVLKMLVAQHPYGFRKITGLESVPDSWRESLGETVVRLRETSVLPQAPAIHYHRARGLFLLDRDREAFGEIDEALSLDPRFVPAIALRALLFDVLGEPERSRAELDRGEALCAASWQKAWLASHRANLEGRWADAATAFGELVELGIRRQEPYLGSTVEALFGRGIARMEAGQHIKAIEDFTAAEILWPGTFMEPSLFKAQAYFGLGRRDLAEEEFEKAFAKSEGQATVAAWISGAHLFLDDREGALFWASRPLEGVSATLRGELEIQKAGVLFTLGKTEDALEAIRQARELSPRSTMILFVAGNVFLNLEQNDRADECFRAALAIDPSCASAYGGLAINECYRANYDEAVRLGRRALEIQPRSMPGGWGLGVALGERGDLREAEYWLRRTLDLDPLKSPSTWKFLGRLLEKAGRLEEAVAALQKSWMSYKYFRHDPFINFLLGEAYARLGKNKEAAEAYRTAADHSPTWSWARLKLGETLEKVEETEPALAEYARAIATDRHLGLAYTKASLLLRHLVPPLSDGEGVEELARVLGEARLSGRDDPAFLNLLALLRLRRLDPLKTSGDPAELQETLTLSERAAEKTNRADPEVLATLAECLERAGEARGAVMALREAQVLPGARRHLLETAAEYRRQGLPGAESLFPEAFRERTRRVRESVGLAQEVERLRGVISAGSASLREMRDSWDLWAALSLADLGRSPAELLGDLPPSPAPPAAPGYNSDLRWLLERLVLGEPLRIHCGGEEYRALDGTIWAADRFFVGGMTGNHNGVEIQGTEDDPLYQSERWYPADELGPVGYRLPIPPGRYQVTLHFAEIHWGAAGLRKFDVHIQGKECLVEYEPFAAGHRSAQTKVFVTLVEDGFLDVEFIPRADNPMISALEVRRID